MQVRDIMSTPVIGLTGEATIEEAAALMLARGYTTIPVFSETGQLVGMLTEADLGRVRFAPDLRFENGPDGGTMIGARARLVKQAMRPASIVIPADTDLGELASVMVDANVRCLPVVDGKHVVGIVSWRDLLANLVPR
jgi:CBS domain-containing protein